MAPTSKLITRFAPSPTGLLHLGHAYSAFTAWELARSAQGEFLLRVEDNDTQRCRPEYETALYRDLHWLGLSWPVPVLKLSDRFDVYYAVIDDLLRRGLAYPCNCTRRDIQAALSAPQEGAVAPSVYPGTCRHRTGEQPGPGDAVRLNLSAAVAMLDTAVLDWEETGTGQSVIHHFVPETLLASHGDVVLLRKDTKAAAYHLTVVVDDAAQNVTHVVRGADLAEATPLQRLLQHLLNLPAPTYHHHDLVRDAHGKRLAKRDDARAIARYRTDGYTVPEIRSLLGL